MKFRTKLYLNILFIAFLSVTLALLIIYREARKQLVYELRSNVRTIAATSALFLDGDSIDQIQTPADESSSAYKVITNELLKIRDQNRRKNLYVKSVYLLRPAEEKQGYLSGIANANPDFRETVYVGELFSDEDMQGLLSHLDEVYVPEKYTTSPWGYFMSAYAPIHDSEGKYAATIAIDLYAGQVISHIRKLLAYEIYALIIALAFSGIVGYFLVHRMTTALRQVCMATQAVSDGNLDYTCEVSAKDEFGDLGKAINQMIVGLKEKEKLRLNFARYVSEHILKKLMDLELPSKLKGEKKRITVLFSDIRQFVVLSEQLPPEEVVWRLNEYFDVMLSIIFKNEGTLDKFLGDGVMVEFGAPLDIENPEKKAVQTAVEMQKAMKELQQKWSREGKEPLEMGVGIHTGDAILGTIGSEKRLEYTAIGDTVNVASRLEQETKRRNVHILISEETWKAVKDDYQFEDLGKIQLPGRNETINIYSVKIDD